MRPDIVNDTYSQRGLKFDGSYLIAGPLRRAVQVGWPSVQEEYAIEHGSETLQWFLLDLFDGAQGAFGDLLLAIADAEMRRFNLREEQKQLEDEYPDWWEIRECAEPVAAALERCLAAMSVLRDGEDAA